MPTVGVYIPDYIYKEVLKEKKGISLFTLINEMVTWKKQNEFSWLSEVNSQTLQHSLRQLDIAYTNFLGTTDNVVDFADSIFYGELNSPSDLSLSYIAYWLRNSIGSLNNLLGISITINTDSPFSFSTALNEQEKAIYKTLFKIFYYGRK